jgi:hypothetical protein
LQERLVLPRSRPLDDSSLMSTYQARGSAQRQRWEETTQGYQRLKDPVTGQLYDMPFENYDATRGGYPNPQRPGELLVPAE